MSGTLLPSEWSLIRTSNLAQPASNWNRFGASVHQRSRPCVAALRRYFRLCTQAWRSHSGRIEREYDYQDETGELLFKVVRYRDPKNFRQRRPDPSGQGGWIWNLSDTRRVLYRLPELLAAPEDSIVFFVEGEKDVDRLRSLELHATTSPQGAGRWRDEYADGLPVVRVVAIADNDPSGEKYARDVVASFHNREIPGGIREECRHF